MVAENRELILEFQMVMEDKESCGSRRVETPPSAKSRAQQKKAEVYNEVLRRLKEGGLDEAQEMDFDDQLWAHFNRLPPRFHLYPSINGDAFINASS